MRDDPRELAKRDAEERAALAALMPELRRVFECGRLRIVGLGRGDTPIASIVLDVRGASIAGRDVEIHGRASLDVSS